MQLDTKGFHKAYCEPETYALVHYSIQETTVFVHHRVCNQGVSWSSSCGWTEELYNKLPSQVSV